MLPRVLRHRWFATFTAASGVVGLGNEFDRLALPLLVLDRTHSVAAVAALRVVQFLPYIVWGPFAGAIIDRLDRRKVMLACDGGQGLAYGLMAATVLDGAFELWQLYVLTFVAEAFGATWDLISDFSVVPSLVREEDLTEANAVYLGTDRGVRAIGPALAGLAIATIGIPFALPAYSFRLERAQVVLATLTGIESRALEGRKFDLAVIEHEARRRNLHRSAPRALVEQ